MPSLLNFMVRRMGYHRRSLGSALLSLCLLTTFLALGPIYVGQVLEARASRLIQDARSETLDITVTNPVPVEADVTEVLSRELGTIARTIRQYNRAVGPPPLLPNGMLCGYDYAAGEPITTTSRVAATPSDHCYTIFSFGAVEALFTLVAGRWPETLPPPAASPANAPTIMGDAQVEAVLTSTAATGAEIHLDDVLVVGNRPDQAVVVHIVGLVEPLLGSSDPFWSSKQLVLTGAQRPFGQMEYRFDLGLIVTGAAFEEWIDPIAETNDYAWWVEVDPGKMNAARLAGLSDQLFRLESQLRLENPDIEILTGMKPLLTVFAQEVIRTERAARWLAGMELVFILFLLMTLAGQVLERQRTEWAILAHRGAGRWQLMTMHVLMMSLSGVIAGVAGPLTALGLLSVLSRTGLLTLPGGESLAAAKLSSEVWAMSWLAAGLGIIALSLPAWTAARHSLLKTGGRYCPPRRPIAEWYYLDLVLLFTGAALALRLRLLGNSGLDDPFNLAGPVFLLIGLALTWLRIFPRGVRLAGKMLRRSNGQIAPLALWQVERDPAHYAAFALMVVGITALGAAALTFSATQRARAWEVARRQIGADVSAVIDSSKNPSGADWHALPGVTGSHQLLDLGGNWRSSALSVRLLGVDPVAMAERLPDWREMLAALDEASPPEAGLALPDGTQAITIQINSTASPDSVTRVIPELRLINDVGVTESVLMSAADPTASERFEAFSGTLPGGWEGHTWRLVGLRFLSERDQADFTHTVYLDDVAVVDQQGHAAILEDFESDGASKWLPDSNQNADALIASRSTQHAVEGTSSLEITYRVRHVQFTEVYPLLTINPAPNVPLPVVVSQALAEEISERINNSSGIVGSKNILDLDLSFGRFPLAYQVVGITSTFPGTTDGARFIVAPVDTLLNRLNADHRPPTSYDINRVWLTLNSRQPDTAFREAIAVNPSIRETTYAWDDYVELQRDPLVNAAMVILYAGFGITLALCMLISGFCFAALFQRDRAIMGTLQALGWETRRVWWLLAAEQVILLLTALIVGLILGSVLIGLLLPFLTPIHSASLTLPLLADLGLLAGIFILLVTVFVATAAGWRRMRIVQNLRFEDE